MNNIINFRKNAFHPALIVSGVVMAVFILSFLWAQSTHAFISRQLDLGDRGEEVTELQRFLSANPNLYPSGLVTGYFGTLTQAAVQRFQVSKGLVSSGTPTSTGYGRVGPVTLAAINAQMGGGSTGGIDKSSPVIHSLTVSTSNTSATLDWNTTENAAAIVYYGTAPINMQEANANMGVTIFSNSTFLVHTDLRTSHSATLTGLQSNTTYNYVVYVRDGLGNESILWPSTFRTK